MHILPGYVTAVRQHETSLLMCVERSSKLLRAVHVLREMLDAYERTNDRSAAEAAVVGQTVITL